MNRTVLYQQIKAAIASQDQLVFTYRKDDGSQIVRMATPMQLEASAKLDEETDFEDIKVKCVQQLPKEGWRYFFLHKIEDFHRVTARCIFAPESVYKDDEASEVD